MRREGDYTKIKRAKTTVECKWDSCKVKYELSPYQVDAGLKEFCSRQCAVDYRMKYNKKSYAKAGTTRKKKGKQSTEQERIRYNRPAIESILSRKWI